MHPTPHLHPYALQAYQGAYPMARLSSFLKRAAPEVRDEIGRLRQWVAERPQLLRIVKDEGTNTWMVRLTEPVASPHSYRDEPAAPPFVGVEDWVYFQADGPTTALIERARWALAQLLERRIGSGAAMSDAESRLVDAICEALDQDDRSPPPR